MPYNEEDNRKVDSISVTLTYIQRDIQDIKTQLGQIDTHYVTKAEIAPYIKVVQGLVAIMLTAVIVAIVGLVVNK